MSKKDIVTIICYGKETKMEREEAKALYLEGMMCCEGSEQERYANIYAELMAGFSVCTDGE